MILKREILAAEARKLIEFHDGDWDSMHAIVTLHPDGEGGLRAGTWAAVAQDVDPRSYPALIARLAAETQADRPEDPAYAYGALIEAFGMPTPGPDATAEYRERYERARITGTFGEQPEAVERAVAWVADIHGRSWECWKRRDTGEAGEFFRAPGAAGGSIRGALIKAARATGVAAWGMPPHNGELN